ncbi:hypothetical protein EG329_000248 [Mollisiaceae sp. DMI_Dod_QoI]|nr:hypothetical protein EG329_000248 [Helotiales sp. DMI_Dod_QoI]
MVAGIETGWRLLSLPENLPSDVAHSILLCSTASRSRAKYSTHTLSSVPRLTHPGAKMPFWGKVVYVAGGRSYEIEDKLWELEGDWLGRENSEVLKKGQEFLMGGGVSWDTEKRVGVGMGSKL